MSSIAEFEWVGHSQTVYKYFIQEVPASFEEHEAGNYVFARMDDKDLWVPIYIGEGNLQDSANNHYRLKCIREKGATHFHFRLNKSEYVRRAEQHDLISIYPNAFEPDGCNQRLRVM